MIGFVADHDALDHRLQLVAETGPGRLDLADGFFERLGLAPTGHSGDALQQGAGGDANHRCVDGMVAMVVSVFLVVVGEERIEPPLPAQHFGHPAGDDTHMVLAR